MALVTFTDSSGRAWRVWSVERQQLPSGSREYLEPRYRSGWIAFERVDGGERRRLGDPPPDWARLDAKALESLCARATPAMRIAPDARLDRHRDQSGSLRP